MSEDVIRSYWQRVWCEGSGDAVLELYAEGATENAEPIDREDFARKVVGWFAKFPDFSATVDDIFTVGDRVVSRVTYRGTHTQPWAGLPPTGKAFTGLGLDVFTVRDGRIVEHWHSTDHYDMVVQLGGTVVPG